MTVKKIELFTKSFDNMDEEEKQRYERNRVLIDLNCIPDKYREMILEKYNVDKDTGRKHLMKYFMENKLKNLMADIGDF